MSKNTYIGVISIDRHKIILTSKTKIENNVRSQGRSQRGAKAAKVIQILAKCFAFIAAPSNEKRNFKTSSELIIPSMKICDFYSLT